MKSVVVIGGGTGNYSVLKSLKPYTKNGGITLTAIVSVTDSGGSSGVLRDEFGILPPGDIRQCLVALSEETDIMKQLFQHRFEGEGTLGDHSFGNLFLTALTQILGSEAVAIQKAQKLLKVNGDVVPVTLEKTHLCAELEDGEIIKRESSIDLPRASSHKKIRRLFLERQVAPNRDAIAAIKKADVIIIGPGDMYTSILPNILIPEIAQEIIHSTALKVYNCNIMTKFGETNGFTVDQHVKTLEQYLAPDIFDKVTYNTTRISPELLTTYAAEHAEPVLYKEISGAKSGYYIGADFLQATHIARHDTAKLGKVLYELIRTAP